MSKSSWIKKLQKNTYFIEEVRIEFNLMVDDLKDIWEALKISLNEYPKEVNDKTKLVSFREAERFFDGEISRTILQSRAKDGIFRLVDGKMIQEELKEFQKIIKLKNLFLKAKAIVPSKDIYNKNVLAVIPQSMTNIGVGRLDQEIKATAMLMQDKFVQNFLNNLELVSVSKIKLKSLHEEVKASLKSKE